MKLALVRVNNIPELPEEKRLYSPPLGLMYLASSLLGSRLPVEVCILDMALQRIDGAGFAEYLQREQPDVVGLSALSCEAEELALVASVTKAWRRDCVVVAGGPHPTLFAEQVLHNPDVDFVVVGEGEETLVELVAALADARGPSAIAGVGSRLNGGIHLASPRPPPAELDALPFPAWGLIDVRAYQLEDSFNVLLKRLPYMSILTSRGCPYSCTYCHHLFGKRVRLRSAQSVVAEIAALHDCCGIREIHVIDDFFNVDKGRALEIFRLLRARGLALPMAFPNGLRADQMDRELIREMKASGVYAANYAVESASPRIQQLVQKRLDLGKAREVIRWTRKEGIFTSGFFMLGFPSETPEEIEQTVEFAHTSELNRAHFFTVVPHPGTELHRLAVETFPGLTSGPDTKATRTYFSKTPFFQQATGVDLGKIQDAAYRRFYFHRPWRMVSFLARAAIFWLRRLAYERRARRSVGRQLEAEPMSEPEEVQAYEVLTRDHRTYDDEVISKKVQAMLPLDRPIRLVDVGCGTGRIALRLLRARPNLQITCVDLSNGMLQQARRNIVSEAPDALGRVTFLNADGKQLPFADGAFDFGFCCYTLHHVKAPERMLREVGRVTRPDGGLFFFDLQRKGGRLLELWVRFFTMTYPEGVRKLYRDSLKAALSLAEFKLAVIASQVPGLEVGTRLFFDLVAARRLE